MVYSSKLENGAECDVENPCREYGIRLFQHITSDDIVDTSFEPYIGALRERLRPFVPQVTALVFGTGSVGPLYFFASYQLQWNCEVWTSSRLVYLQSFQKMEFI